MAITRYSNFDKTVNTIIERNNIQNRVPGMTVVVLDAIADPNVGTGKAIYRWDDSDGSWILVSKGTTDTMNFITEENIITNNEINLSYIPVNNQIWNGLIINDGLIYADLNVKQVIIANGKITNIPIEHNGMTLRVTYAYGTIASQVITAIDAAVTEKFDELSGFSVDAIQTELDRTQLNLGLDSEGNYVKSVGANYISTAISVKDANEKLDAAIKTVDNKAPNLSSYNNHIIPSISSTFDLGSTTNRFRSIYVDEAYLSTNTLYIGDTPVMGTESDTIVIKADAGQSVSVKTTGIGSTSLISENEVNINTQGINADVKIQSTGTNSKVRLSGTGGIELSSNVSAQQDVAISGNLTITGNLVANGSQFLVNANTVTTRDNIITLNQGEVGTGVTAGKAGIQIDRGESADFQLVFDETDDKFKVGVVDGVLETLATREYVSSVITSNPHTTLSGYGITDAYTKTETDNALNNKVNKTGVEALHSTDALRISGTTLSLYKGDGTFESVVTQDTIYTLPTATSAIKGGIEIFSDTVQTVAANTISTSAGRTYGVQLNSAGQAVVNVPWSDTNTVYTHPNSGVTAGTYSKVTVNTLGHITAGASLSASDIPNLDASKITTGTIDPARLPSFVDDVLEFTNLAGFPVTGETGKIYIALDTNKTYRWSGSTYVFITSGAVDSVAGKTGVVTLTKSDVGLDNVDNTSDASKNVLSATKLINARTINGVSFNGTANIVIPTQSSLGTNIASAATTNIGTAGTKDSVHITGTTTITSLGTSTTGTLRTVIFDNSLTLTYNASKIIFPSAVNIKTEPGDVFVFLCEDGSIGNWRCLSTFPMRIW